MAEQTEALHGGRGQLLPDFASGRFHLAKALFMDLRSLGAKRECLQAEEAVRIWLDCLAEHMSRPTEFLWLDAVRIETHEGPSARMVLMDRGTGYIETIPTEAEPDLGEVVLALLLAEGNGEERAAVTITHSGVRYNRLPIWAQEEASAS